jgi:hypothetical protein
MRDNECVTSGRGNFTRHPGMEVHSILDLPIPTSTDLSHALLPCRLQYIHIQKLQTVLLAFHQSELGVAVCAAEYAEAQICIPWIPLNTWTTN